MATIFQVTAIAFLVLWLVIQVIGRYPTLRAIVFPEAGTVKGGSIRKGIRSTVIHLSAGVLILGFWILTWIELQKFVTQLGRLSDWRFGLMLLVCFGMLLTAAGITGFMIGGSLQKRFERSWPKMLDFPYYLFGGLILATVASQSIGAPGNINPLIIEIEVFICLNLFTLKIYKSAAEIWPGAFANKQKPLRFFVQKDA